MIFGHLEWLFGHLPRLNYGCKIEHLQHCTLNNNLIYSCLDFHMVLQPLLWLSRLFTLTVLFTFRCPHLHWWSPFISLINEPRYCNSNPLPLIVIAWSQHISQNHICGFVDQTITKKKKKKTHTWYINIQGCAQFGKGGFFTNLLSNQ